MTFVPSVRLVLCILNDSFAAAELKMLYTCYNTTSMVRLPAHPFIRKKKNHIKASIKCVGLYLVQGSSHDYTHFFVITLEATKNFKILMYF